MSYLNEQLGHAPEAPAQLVEAIETIEEQEGAEIMKISDFAFFDIAKGLFQEVGELENVTTETPLKDYAGKKLPCKYLIETDNIHKATQIAQALDMGIVVIGALTSGTNNFGPNKAYEGLRGIIAIKPKGIADEAPQTTPENEAIQNKSNQLVIHNTPNGHTITAGAGLTLAQLNKTIERELGPEFYLPLDHTTVDTALVGGVFATGAMGPGRVRPHQIIESVTMTNGETLQTLTGKEIEHHEGLLGMDGGVTEITFRIMERPKNRFGLTVPLQNTSTENYQEKAATLLAQLYPFTNLKFEGNKVTSDWEGGFIDGVEIITKESLELVAANSTNVQTRGEATKLLGELKRANSTYMLYLTGNSHQTVYEMMESLETQDTPPLTTLLKLNEQGVIGEFSPIIKAKSLEKMRVLREAIPEFAKAAGKPNKETPNVKVFSTSTDINLRIRPEIANKLTPEQLAEKFRRILQPYIEQERELYKLAQEAAAQNVTVTMERYGHMNPREIDPHTRQTAKSENAEALKAVQKAINDIKAKLIEACLALPQQDHDLEVLHGEKGKLTGPKLLSEEVMQRSLQIVEDAGRQWNFRQQEVLRAKLQHSRVTAAAA